VDPGPLAIDRVALASVVTPTALAARNRRRFGILLLLAYVALSWAVRFDMGLGEQIASLVYPLDTFSMYAGPPRDTIGHLLVRDANGEIHRVRDFAAYQCDAELKRGTTACADEGFPYHYDDLVRYVDGHSGSGTIPVDLIFRTWRLRQSEPPSVEADCVISRCMVAP
jgi:hypothetical protein